MGWRDALEGANGEPGWKAVPLMVRLTRWIQGNATMTGILAILVAFFVGGALASSYYEAPYVTMSEVDCIEVCVS